MLIGLELIVLIWLYRQWLFSFSGPLPLPAFFREIKQLVDQAAAGSAWYRNTVLVLAWIAIAAFIAYWWHHLGNVFRPWDPIVSYNPWALQWASDQLPAFTYHYPQLMAANWSLFYVLMGLPLQQFPHAAMGLFPLMILLGLVDLARLTKNFGYWVSIVVTACLFTWMMWVYFAAGYVDIAASALAFLAVVALFYARQNSDKAGSYLVLGSLMVAASALTKQSGLYWVMVYPLLSYWMVSKPTWGSRLGCFTALWQWVLMGLLVAPWYVIAMVMVRWGLNGSEFHFLTHQLSYASSLWQEISISWAQSGKVYLILLVVALLLSWRVKGWQVIFWWVILPYSLIWMFWFHYDDRNLAMTIPLLGTLIGLIWDSFTYRGWGQYLIVLLARGARQMRWIEYLIVITVAIGMLGTMPGFRTQDWIHSQIKQQREIGDMALNRALYHYAKEQGLQGTILTAWPLVSDLPGVSSQIQVLSHRFYGPDMLPNVFSSVTELKAALLAYPQIRYLLVVDRFDLLAKPVKAYLAEQVKAGRYQLKWQVGHFSFYAIIVS